MSIRREKQGLAQPEAVLALDESPNDLNPAGLSQEMEEISPIHSTTPSRLAVGSRLQRNQSRCIPKASPPSGFFLKKKPPRRLFARTRLLWFRSSHVPLLVRLIPANALGRGTGHNNRCGCVRYFRTSTRPQGILNRS